MPYTFAFDHSASDGAGGYGAVRVITPDDDVHYIGRAFARTALVERFPDAGLTYDEAARLSTYLSGGTSFSRVARFAGLVATNRGEFFRGEPGDFDLSAWYDCDTGDHYWSDAVARTETCQICGSQREAR
jgi:hypothetical protein